MHGHQKYKTAGVPEIVNTNLMRNANKGTPSGMLPEEEEGGGSTPRKIGWGPTVRIPQSLLYL